MSQYSLPVIQEACKKKRPHHRDYFFGHLATMGSKQFGLTVWKYQFGLCMRHPPLRRLLSSAVAMETITTEGWAAASNPGFEHLCRSEEGGGGSDGQMHLAFSHHSVFLHVYPSYGRSMIIPHYTLLLVLHAL